MMLKRRKEYLFRKKKVVSQKEKKKFSFGDFFDILKSQPTLVITLFYFYLTIIGLSYSYSLLKNFNINIFDYSSLTDFVSIPLRTPELFYQPIGFLIIVLLIDRYTLFSMKKKHNKRSLDNYRIMLKIYKLITVPIIFLYVIADASFYGNDKYDLIMGRITALNINQSIPFALTKIFLNSPQKFPESKVYFDLGGRTDTLKGRLISSTNNYFFYYVPKDSTTLAINKSSVKKVVYEEN